jgi:hypothetical protein
MAWNSVFKAPAEGKAIFAFPQAKATSST